MELHLAPGFDMENVEIERKFLRLHYFKFFNDKPGSLGFERPMASLAPRFRPSLSITAVPGVGAKLKLINSNNYLPCTDRNLRNSFFPFRIMFMSPVKLI